MAGKVDGNKPKRATVRQLPRATGHETIEEAAEKWPDMTPWPLPAAAHCNRGTAGWEKREILGGPQSPAEILGVGADVLLIHIAQSKAMGSAPVVAQTTVAQHDAWGDFYLRAVKHEDGILIGVVDGAGATYCACEWYEPEEAQAGWIAWIKALS